MYDLPCSAEPVQDMALLAEQLNKPLHLEQDKPKMRRHQSRQALQPSGDRKNQEGKKMVAK